MSLAKQKAALRKEMYARRKPAHEAGGDAGANALLAARLGAISAATVIAGYRPIRTEIDPTPTMSAVLLAGARTCVPVIDAMGRPLMFREWTPRSDMVAGAFGALIPVAGAMLIPTILIVPLLAWDRAGGRLGYGGGFYDRTLAQLRAAGPALAVGFAYAAQEIDEVPREPTDETLDAIVTETEIVEVAR